jgi:hypothetical protein
VDDNPFPKNPQVLAKLEQTREIGMNIQSLLSEPTARFKRALAYFETESIRIDVVPVQTVLKLAAQYHWAATWLTTMAETEKIEDHVDTFLQSKYFANSQEIWSL